VKYAVATRRKRITKIIQSHSMFGGFANNITSNITTRATRKRPRALQPRHMAKSAHVRARAGQPLHRLMTYNNNKKDDTNENKIISRRAVNRRSQSTQARDER
jgi:hypothetical protein